MAFTPGVSKEADGQRRPDDLIQTPSPESTNQGETVIFDPARDSVGTPDYGALAREAFLSRSKAAKNPAMAEFYIPEGSTDYPIDFHEPAPFAIRGSEQWNTYLERTRVIEETQASVREESLKGADID